VANVSNGQHLTTIDPESLGFSRARLARIGAWYQARVESGDVAGAVVAIARGDDLAYLQAVGFQDRAKTVPMQPDSIFWIASMTKPITSVAAMILVEDGNLALDASVAQYLPELRDMRVGVEETDPATGEVEIRRVPSKRAMTVRDLLRHTSGLVYPPQFIDAPINRLYRQAHFSGDNTLAEFVTSLADFPLAHQPGEVWEYSWGVDVLARVVEVASSQPFDRFLENRIFGPLHMVDTGFYVPEANLGRLVEAPEARPPQFDVTRPRKLLSGGGGLVSTAVDYLHFCQMLLNGGERDRVRILAAKTVKEMTTNSLPPGIEFAGEAIGPDHGSSWGLGFAIRTDPTSSDVPGSVGSHTWGGVWGTYFWIDPAERLIAIQMIQVVPGPVPIFTPAIRNLTYGSLRVSEQSSFVPSASPVVLRPDMLTDYVGKYDFGASSSSRDKLLSPGSAADTNDSRKRHNAINSRAASKILRLGVGRPIDIAATRASAHHPPVALYVQIDAGKLVVEAIGTWPVLDFEKGRPVVLIVVSDDEFVVDVGDHTRIAFVRDAAGKVSGAILNPGPWEQRGARY
jgi:CubicO group peptidase (beta-lactamase class C family)